MYVIWQIGNLTHTRKSVHIKNEKERYRFLQEQLNRGYVAWISWY